MLGSKCRRLNNCCLTEDIFKSTFWEKSSLSDNYVRKRFENIRRDPKRSEKSFVVAQRRPEFRGVLTTASHRGSVWRTAVVPVPRANPQRHVKMTGEGGDTVGADVPWGFAHLSQVREEIKEPTAAGESSAYCNIIHWQNSKQAESEGSVGGSFFFLFCFFIASQDQAFSSPSNMMGEQGKFALLNEIVVCFGLHSAGGGGGGGGIFCKLLVS